MQTAISFPIPLAAALDKEHAHYINPEGKELTNGGEFEPTLCLGTVANPTAEPGNLCVYAKTEFHLGNPLVGNIQGIEGADTSGAMVVFHQSPEATTELLFGRGDWAVTG